jgi:hypothetical protein
LISLLLWGLPQQRYEEVVAEEPSLHIVLTVMPLTTSIAPRLKDWLHKISPKIKKPPGENQSSLEASLSYPSFVGVSYLSPESWDYVEIWELGEE